MGEEGFNHRRGPAGAATSPVIAAAIRARYRLFPLKREGIGNRTWARGQQQNGNEIPTAAFGFGVGSRRRATGQGQRRASLPATLGLHDEWVNNAGNALFII